MTYETTITRERNVLGSDVEYEITLTVEYTAHAAHRGRRDSLCGVRDAGPALEPDEPATIEIESVTDETGMDIDLKPHEESRIIERLSERMADVAQDYPEPDDR